MKKTILLFICIISCLFSKTSRAQVELTPFGGYAVADRFNTAFGTAQVKDAALYGVDLGYIIKHGVEVELSYEHQETKIISDSYNSGNPDFLNQKIPCGINYFLIGGVYGKNVGHAPVQPYGGIALGGVLVDGKSSDGMNWGSEFLFDLRGKVGVKIFPNEGNIGIRLQAQLNVPMQGAGSGIGCGVGTGGAGCGVSVNGYTTITQIGFSAGLIIKFDKGNRESHEIYTH